MAQRLYFLHLHHMSSMVSLAAAKSSIKVALCIEDDDFTLKPASCGLFVATHSGPRM
jgi:hypothetical protein